MNQQENYNHLEIILRDKDEIIATKNLLIESQEKIILRYSELFKTYETFLSEISQIEPENKE